MQLRGRIYCGVYTVVYILWCIYWTVYVGVCIGAVADSVVFPAGSAYRCTVAGEGSEIFSKIAFLMHNELCACGVCTCT